MNDEMIRRIRYSLKNKFKITFTLAPFTFRIAISFRRCSHDNVTKENIPNTAMMIQIKETTLSNLIIVFSDFIKSLYLSSILIRNRSAFGLTLCASSFSFLETVSHVPSLNLKMKFPLSLLLPKRKQRESPDVWEHYNRYP